MVNPIRTAMVSRNPSVLDRVVWLQALARAGQPWKVREEEAWNSGTNRPNITAGIVGIGGCSFAAAMETRK